MFSSLVEVWQLEKNKNLKTHLNNLLIQSLSVDCGRGLDNKPFPDWIQGVTIRRVDVQSPGRDAYQVAIDTKTKVPITDIRLTKWVDKVVSTDSSLTNRSDSVTTNIYTYAQRYNLTNPLSAGLYRIDITAADQESWSAWVIFGDTIAKQVVRWTSKDEWQIQKTELLNSHCPLPKLSISVFDHIDGNYKQIWSESYESDYPTTLDNVSLPSDRYIVTVSMIHQRWQGPLAIEQSQVISKTYDVNVEE
ncbi:copper-sensing two-component system response regulator CusR [Vibrio cholerae]|nr:copper-sensing two-component system response regulator CusR [Vibrio cholerae]CSA78633.1 copper-sensing two-component system response regulator CusR [Vibrio cholerae]CSA84785.1 copper-sensing two-component system response regulator CusR [Vibrio cholerae]CSA89940.1 copper-sensing two-component system response regulator CusR [Vibrio cholerae]CSA92972.1 copper-sensing two-component system response regulator CusR [Vibrio cholerae]